MKTLTTLVLLLTFNLSVFSQKIPEYKKGDFVQDFAGLISPQTKSSLEDLLSKYEKKTSIEIAVVTVPSLQGYSIQDFTYTLATSWKVGKKGTNYGCVLLIAPNERKVRIENGYGMEKILTDAVSSSILRKNKSLLTNQKWDLAVKSIVEDIINNVGSSSKEAREEYQVQKKKDQEKAAQNAKDFFFFLFLGGVGSFLLFLLGKLIKTHFDNLKLYQLNFNTLSKLCAEIPKMAIKMSDMKSSAKKLDDYFIAKEFRPETISSRYVKFIEPSEFDSASKKIANALKIINRKNHASIYKESISIQEKFDSTVRGFVEFCSAATSLKGFINSYDYSGLVKKFKSEEQKAQTKINQDYVSDGTKKKFKKIQADCEEFISKVLPKTSSDRQAWTKLHNQTLSILSRFKEVEKNANSDVEEYKERKKREENHRMSGSTIGGGPSYPSIGYSVSEPSGGINFSGGSFGGGGANSDF